MYTRIINLIFEHFHRFDVKRDPFSCILEWKTSPKFSKLIMHCRQQRNIIIEEAISAVHCASFKIIDIVNSFADKTLPLSQSQLSDILRTINKIISQRDPSVENNRERATSRYRIALNKNIFPIFRLFVPYTYFMLCNFFHCFKGDERKPIFL